MVQWPRVRGWTPPLCRYSLTLLFYIMIYGWSRKYIYGNEHVWFSLITDCYPKQLKTSVPRKAQITKGNIGYTYIHCIHSDGKSDLKRPLCIATKNTSRRYTIYIHTIPYILHFFGKATSTDDSVRTS